MAEIDTVAKAEVKKILKYCRGVYSIATEELNEIGRAIIIVIRSILHECICKITRGVASP